MSLIAGRGCRWPPRRDSVSPCAPLSGGGRDTHDGHENSPILVFFSNLLGTTVDVHESVGVDRIEARMYELARALKTGLRDAGISVATPDAPELSAGVCLVEVPMARRREVLGRLEREHGIAGSPAGGLRLCPHFYNTMEHVERTVAGVVALRDLLA